MGMIRKMLELLDPRERKQAYGLFGLFLLMSLAEVIGIASILPFMSVLTNPDAVVHNEYLKKIYDFFGFESTTRFLFFIGLGVLVVLVMTNIIKATTRWVTLYLGQTWGRSLSRRLFEIYLGQPYRFFLDRNSSDISKNVLAEVQVLTNGVVMAYLDTMTKILVSSVILIFLMLLDPILALVTSVVLGGSYLAVYMFFKKSMKHQALQRSQSQAERYKTVNEAIQGIKNIKLGGYEKVYAGYFKEPSDIFAMSSARNSVIGEMPRYALEVIAFGGILLMTLYMLLQSPQGMGQALPMIALYAFAGYRLMPSMQGIYNGLTKIRFHKPALDIVRRELTFAATMQPVSDKEPDPLHFQNMLSLRNVCFKYAPDGRDILKDVSLDVPAGGMIGIVGKTGAGKTTLVDIILGLLEPISGEVLIDGVAVTPPNNRAWQRNLSYVSQHIYLCDDTIAANIAFGIPAAQINPEKLQAVCRMANLADFIETELPQKYYTIVGENGIRLSGGQRQRIGLARALYLDRPVLVLDEATSALDPATEESVMRAIYGLESKKTIFIISHRLELLSRCDTIAVVQNGSVIQKTVDPSYKTNPQGLKDELMAHVTVGTT